MTRLTGCKQLYALVPGIAAAWNYAEKSISITRRAPATGDVGGADVIVTPKG